jgi:hypothetical protein
MFIMDTFKGIAYEILREAGKPLHSKEITKIALNKGWLKTAGKTPEATMNAQLVVDINSKKDKSRFVKTAPSTFGLNQAISIEVADHIKIEDDVKLKKQYVISKDVSSKQKGDITEARVAELVTLYGDTSLSCYKPISDDEGIDLIVKEKGTLKTLYVQIKSRFGDNPDDIFTATVKASTIKDSYAMTLVFCFFDTERGDLWDYVWFVPAPDFLKMANKLDSGKFLGFVAGRQRKDTNKWDDYLIDRRSLANEIIKQLKRI